MTSNAEMFPCDDVIMDCYTHVVIVVYNTHCIVLKDAGTKGLHFAKVSYV